MPVVSCVLMFVVCKFMCCCCVLVLVVAVWCCFLLLFLGARCACLPLVRSLSLFDFRCYCLVVDGCCCYSWSLVISVCCRL